MKLFLVRHAEAGSRPEWVGSDELRPLSDRGLTQAAGVADLLADEPITRVLSSHAVRCVQTVEPLAERLGVEVEVCNTLYEGSASDEVLLLAESVATENAVFCSHGDVIPELLRGLVNRGMTMLDDWTWAKGSTWEITRDGDKFTEARYHPTQTP